MITLQGLGPCSLLVSVPFHACQSYIILTFLMLTLCPLVPLPQIL
jgi:hypothetical protein